MAGVTLFLSAALLAQHPGYSTWTNGAVRGCTFADQRGVEPRVAGEPSSLAGLKRVYVATLPTDEVRQNIVNVLRRELPEVVVVRTFQEADVMLGFDVVRSIPNGGRGERTGGWGTGCVFRRAAPDEVVSVVGFDGRYAAPESVLGSGFAWAFVSAYRKANAR